jgi:hypothetical protein
MKNVQKLLLRQRTRYSLGSVSTKLATVMVAVAIFAGSTLVSKARDSVTQLSYIQSLVQLCGDSGQFKNTSTPQDYVQWAQGKGMVPNGGWQPTAKLTRDILAQTLVQLYGLNTKKSGGDFVRTLQKEGIDVGESEDISRGGLIAVFDDALFLSRLGNVGHHKGSPHKPPHPPHPPKGGWHHGNDGDHGNSDNH